MSAISDDNNPPANTDGWDLYQSDNIVIQNSIINNGDDCLALKANSTNVVVQGLQCNGSHGISIGSLGEELGEIDIVENVYIYNNSLSNSTEGAAIRLKVVPNINPRNPNNDDGGGSGYIRNVTYDTFQAIDVPYAIAIDQCYDYDNETYCNQYPVSNSNKANLQRTILTIDGSPRWPSRTLSSRTSGEKRGQNTDSMLVT